MRYVSTTLVNPSIVLPPVPCPCTAEYFVLRGGFKLRWANIPDYLPEQNPHHGFIISRDPWKIIGEQAMAIIRSPNLGRGHGPDVGNAIKRKGKWWVIPAQTGVQLSKHVQRGNEHQFA